MSQKPRIGFIGLGLMGAGIAGNILAKGYPLRVMAHRNRAPVEALVAKGAVEATSPAELARGADMVLICVTSSVEVEAVISGPNGILEAARDGLIVIDITTADPASTRRLAAALAENGGVLVDAPVTRTPKEAAEGRLNAIVGAAPGMLARIRPVLETYCENIFHVGPTGSGHTVKLLNNFLSQSMHALLGEAFATADRAGVDPEKLCQVLASGGANSGAFQAVSPYYLSGDDSRIRFSIRNAEKDLRYYNRMAESLGAVSFMGHTAQQVMTLAAGLGYADSYVSHIYEALAGLDAHAAPVPNQPTSPRE